MLNKWINTEIQKIQSYQGTLIQKAMVWEMAIIETDDGNHQFEHPDCPFIQAQVLYLWCENIGIVKFTTYQNNCNWGIHSLILENTNELNYQPECDSIYRMRSCNAFALGVLSDVSILQDDNDDVFEITLQIEGCKALLKTGEVVENHDGTIIIRDNDESVLLFLNAEDSKKVRFNDNTIIKNNNS